MLDIAVERLLQPTSQHNARNTLVPFQQRVCFPQNLGPRYKPQDACLQWDAATAKTHLLKQPSKLREMRSHLTQKRRTPTSPQKARKRKTHNSWPYMYCSTFGMHRHLWFQPFGDTLPENSPPLHPTMRPTYQLK